MELSDLNPYCQILENISKNRVVTQRVSWKIFPGFFQNVWFRVMNEEHFWKIFPAEFHDYLLKKKRFWKSGHDSEGFMENFSRQISSIPTQEKCFKKIVWKNFPEILLSHHPKIVNFNFYLKSCILEKFSKNSPESWPKILKMGFGNIFQKTSWVTTRIFRCDQFWTQIIKIGNLRGLLWYHA